MLLYTEVVPIPGNEEPTPIFGIGSHEIKYLSSFFIVVSLSPVVASRACRMNSNGNKLYKSSSRQAFLLAVAEARREANGR